MEYKEVTKKEYEELFKWLFGNNVKIKQEVDIVMAHYYEDINIYYTDQIYDLFQTQAMKRMGKVLQLGAMSSNRPNAYHTRLEHSKGAYRNYIEFLAIQYRNPNWKEYIQTNKLKAYLVEKMKFLCRHDVGHSMVSHSIEGMFSCTHEEIGEKIVQEDEQIKNALDKIKADEVNSNLEGDGSLELFCEGNVDFDRMDYLTRDGLYLGNEDYNYMHVLKFMCNLKYVQETKKYCYVYKSEALPYIEEFLSKRDNMYKNGYRSKQTKITDKIWSYLVKQIQEGKIQNTDKLKRCFNITIGKKIEDVDVDRFLKTDYMVFLNQLMGRDINEIESNEILNYSIPDNKQLLQIAIDFLDPKNTNYNEYSQEEKEFLRNIRNLISKRNDNLKKNIDDITISVEIKEDKTDEILGQIKDVLVNKENISRFYSYKNTFKKYNNKEPIYIEHKKSGKIYTLDKHPDLKMDLSNDYTYGVFAIIPELKEQKITNEEIEKIKKILANYKNNDDRHTNKNDIKQNRMNMFKVEYNKNYVHKMDEYFDEGRQ